MIDGERESVMNIRPLALVVFLLVVRLSFRTMAQPAGGVAGRPTDWPDHPENVRVKQRPREGTPVPKLVYEGSGAYDPYNRAWIHSSGHDGIPQGFHLFLYHLKTGVWEQKSVKKPANRE